MRTAARLLALIALVVAAACDPTPRVFADRGHDALTAVPAAAGVVVAPIEGLEGALGDELREAVADGLRSQGIPATTAARSRSSATLHGVADAPPGGGTAYIAWTLDGAGGGELRSFTGTAQLVPGRIAQQNAGAVSNIVRQVNDALAGAGRRPLQPGGVRAGAQGPAISVLPVEGAPGDGRTVLAEALGQALRSRGLPVSDALDADGLIVFGDVLVEPLGDRREKVTITWQLRWADGRELGVVSQANTVPQGATGASWRPVAPVIADNAADGIARLVREGLPPPGDAAR